MLDKVRFIAALIAILELTGCATSTPMQNLTKAIDTNNTEIAKSAIAAGANKNQALVAAAKANSLKMVKFLLDNGAWVNAYDNSDYSFAFVKIVDAKTRKEYDIWVREENGGWIIEASDSRDKEEVDRVSKTGCYFKYGFTTSSGPNALHYAIANANVQMVEVLLDRGFDVRTEYTIEGVKLPGPYSTQGIAEMLDKGIKLNLRAGSDWFVSEGGPFLMSNTLPFPAKKTTILQEAKRCGNATIIELISKKEKNDYEEINAKTDGYGTASLEETLSWIKAKAESAQTIFKDISFNFNKCECEYSYTNKNTSYKSTSSYKFNLVGFKEISIKNKRKATSVQLIADDPIVVQKLIDAREYKSKTVYVYMEENMLEKAKNAFKHAILLCEGGQDTVK